MTGTTPNVDTIICGDCLEVLKTLPAESVDCCITSPPYYGLRDYGIGGQIGLEPTPEAYVARLVEVFREVRRVLKKEGTLWLNLGDSYAGSSGCHKGGSEKANSNAGATNSYIMPKPGKPKDLIGIPWMVAFALRADGWYLRSDIIWHKPNCMPESCKDRPTKAHEYIFLLSKSQKYYYDNEAIKDPLQTNAPRTTKNGEGNGELAHGHFGQSKNGRNKRTVWTIPTRPYKEAHFATFPEALVEPCILAGTSEKGYCPACGKAWIRQVERGDIVSRADNGNKHPPVLSAVLSGQGTNGTGKSSLAMTRDVKTLGWLPSCQCASKPRPGIVLDPFFGAGTVGLVAKKLGRHYIGIELNPEYISMAKTRVQKTPVNLRSFEEGARQ